MKKTRKRTCVGCLWHWVNVPEGLVPGWCYCKQSKQFHTHPNGGCEYYEQAVKMLRYRYKYGKTASTDPKVHHNKMFIGGV